ncbi:hypothetical protein HUG10_04305 [Halorarum halophilum]|uniref:Uncharacterized protein n=1 Tax=Halorarum halophilum TaxID=2743090 RepID=A0A7D5GEA9_9EURY|nr:hypothetical protein [Halobaculum halophilum]QLG26810.1 hypothetical protein HUG10_04305 [Halobaculum halophilum]
MTVRDDDPRFGDSYVRQELDSPTGGRVTLVGVVHDHPASTYRVRTVVDAVDPDVLALELPPLAVGLFEQYAEGERTPPTFGGEMSAAIQAARTDAVAGIDGPDRAFYRRLVRTLSRERPSRPEAKRILSGLASASKRAVVCRVAGALAARTGVRLEVDVPVAHDCTWADDPEDQAADERRQIRQSQALTSALGPCTASRATAFRDATREAHMADRLADLRETGSVVAVVGIDHLDPLSELLDGTGN